MFKILSNRTYLIILAELLDGGIFPLEADGEFPLLVLQLVVALLQPQMRVERDFLVFVDGLQLSRRLLKPLGRGLELGTKVDLGQSRIIAKKVL